MSRNLLFHALSVDEIALEVSAERARKWGKKRGKEACSCSEKKEEEGREKGLGKLSQDCASTVCEEESSPCGIGFQFLSFLLLFL